MKCAELFSDELSLADLKVFVKFQKIMCEYTYMYFVRAWLFSLPLQGRRAVAIRAIDQKRGGMPNEGHFYERKIALLSKEDQIEADFEKMVQ